MVPEVDERKHYPRGQLLQSSSAPTGYAPQIATQKGLCDATVTPTPYTSWPPVVFGAKVKCSISSSARSLLSESPVLSEKEIYDETLVMILGAYETTATVNGFAIMLLAFHLEIQNKAFQELSDIFGNDQIRPATFQDVQEMKYLEQIIKETLRLYPPVPIIPRTVEEEIKIKNYTLPVGTIVLINLLGGTKAIRLSMMKKMTDNALRVGIGAHMRIDPVAIATTWTMSTTLNIC
uniref:Cytochrome P450 n=1 Tax=Timema genevievae TaxID=629358 RepID=A0A7R9JUT2_TIMGE|nr:unnamed protein product [Timema genevievae]